MDTEFTLKLSWLPLVLIRLVLWASERRGWPPSFSASLRTRCSPPDVLVCLWAGAAPSLPFSPSSSVTHTNHAPLQSIMTVPSSVLLQPHPPIVLSSTHPLHQSLRSTAADVRLPFPRLSIDFAPAVTKALPIVAAVLVLLLHHPHFIRFFFFSYHCVKIKKKPLCWVGWRKIEGGLFPQREACDWWSETPLKASQALIGEEREALMNMHKGAMKRPLQQWRVEGPPLLEQPWFMNNNQQVSHPVADVAGSERRRALRLSLWVWRPCRPRIECRSPDKRVNTYERVWLPFLLHLISWCWVFY